MEKQQKKEMNREYTQYRGGDIRMDTYSIQMVLHHPPKGLLPSSVSALDQEKLWNCEYCGKQRLSEYCCKSGLGREDLCWLYGSIINNLKEIQEFLLNPNHLFLDPEEIYLNSREHKVWNCFVPFYEKNIWQSFMELSQYLLGHLDQNDPEAVQIAYGMFQYFAKENCNIEGAWKILCEKSSAVKVPYEGKEPRRYLEIIEEIPLETITEIEESHTLKRKQFPRAAWIIMGLSGAAAVFLAAYVAFNEWYLSDTMKIVILTLVAILGAVGVMAWKRWSPEMKKENPLEGSLEKVEPEKTELKETELKEAEPKEVAQTELIGAAPGIVRLVRMDTGTEYVVTQMPAIIGKIAKKVQIEINEPAISRIHGRISCLCGEYYLEDLSSTNGTYINGVALEPKKPVRLNQDDVLVFANISFIFDCKM